MFGGSLSALLIVIGGVCVIKQKDREVEEQKAELYGVMDSIPKEHRQSVGKVLEVLEEHFPNENVSYRMKNLRENYKI